MADLGTLVPASPLNANDATRHAFTNDIDLEVASYALADVPIDFGTMDANPSWQVDYSVVGYADDSYGLQIRIVNGATILAAADAGGTFSDVDLAITSATDTLSSVTAFAYTNTTANKATWNGASVEIRQLYLKTKGNDVGHVEVDYVAITGTYTAGANGVALDATLAALTSTADASLSIAASVTATLSACTVSSTAGVLSFAEAANTLGNLTLSADASNGTGIKADLAKTLGALSSSSGATTTIQGAAGITLDTVALSSGVSTTIQSDLVKTLEGLALSSAVQVQSEAIQADAANTLDDSTLASAVQVGIGGLLGAAALGDLQGTSSVSITAQLQPKFRGDLGGSPYSGVALASKSTNFVPSTSITAGLVLGTLDDLTSTAQASIAIQGTSTVTLGADTLTSTASIDIAATLTATLDTLVLESEGVSVIGCSLDATLGDLALASDVALLVQATLSSALEDLALESATGVLIQGESSTTLESMIALSSVEVLFGLVGFYLGVDVPLDNPNKGGGFHNTHSVEGGADTGFYGPASNNSGSNGGFWNE